MQIVVMERRGRDLSRQRGLQQSPPGTTWAGGTISPLRKSSAPRPWMLEDEGATLRSNVTPSPSFYLPFSWLKLPARSGCKGEASVPIPYLVSSPVKIRSTSTLLSVVSRVPLDGEQQA